MKQSNSKSRSTRNIEPSGSKSINRFVVIDCETTGLGKFDRICEISLITLDAKSFECVEEYDTIVNPERDMGPVHIHGISASAAENAPIFKEIAPVVARRLDGAVLIAHNLAFDVDRMLTREFSRLEGWFNMGNGLCTYRESGVNLAKACKRFGIPLEQQHRALCDARATAELAKQLFKNNSVLSCSPSYFSIRGEPNPRTFRREAAGLPGNTMPRKISFFHSPWRDQPTGIYRYALNYALDDGVIDREEQHKLSVLASELGLTPEDERAIRELHLASVIASAEYDGVFSSIERDYIARLASTLGIDYEDLPKVTELNNTDTLEVGMHICFTGTVCINGEVISRVRLEKRAVLAGLNPVSNVTKKGCDILVTADVASQSGKARKARSYKKPILSVEEFLLQLRDPLISN